MQGDSTESEFWLGRQGKTKELPPEAALIEKPEFVPRDLYEQERLARLTTEALLEARSRELSETNRKLVLETEAVRAALSETEVARAREALALKDKLILSEALLALSGKSSADEAMAELLQCLKREFGCEMVWYLRAEPLGARIAASVVPESLGTILPIRRDVLIRPRRLASLSAVLDGAELPDGCDDFQSVLLVPLTLPEDEDGALLLGSVRSGQFTAGDMRLLERVAQFAVQSLTALRVARRNALLVSLIEGDKIAPNHSILDAPLEAVHQAFARLTDMQGSVVSILDALLAAPLTEIDRAIESALAEMGKLTGTDRVYVFRFRPDHLFMDNSHEWAAPGIESFKQVLQEVPVALAAVWNEAFAEGREVIIPDVALMQDGKPEKDALVEQGIRSLLAVPLIIDGEVEGFVGYDSVIALRKFLPGEIYLIRSVAKVIAAVLARRDAETALIVAHGEALAQRARLESVLGAMPDLILELDRDGRFVEWHSGMIEVSKQTDAFFRGRLLEETLPPDLAALGRALIASLEAGQPAASLEFPFSFDGRDRWWQLSAVLLGSNGYLFVMRDITEARTLSAEIRRLSEIVRRTTNLVVISNSKQRIEWVNEAFERCTGFTLDEVKGQSPEIYLQTTKIDPDTIERLKRAFEKGEAIEVELPARRRDGREFWLALDIQALRGLDGAIEGYMAVQTDITDRRQQAEALRAAARSAALARATLESAVEAMHDGFALFDRDDRLVVFNQHYREFLPMISEFIEVGATFEDILKCSLSRRMIPDAIGREEEWLARRMARHLAAYSETEVALSDGRWVRVVERATSDGGHVGLWTDITELKLAEKRALADRATAMEASQDGIAITDADGCFLYMNEACCRLFGFASNAEPIGRHWSTLYTEENAAWLAQHAVPILHATRRWSGEVQGRSVSGRMIDQDLSLTLKDDGGMLLIVRDISEKRHASAERDRLQEQLQLAQRREIVGQMAAGLAHDFNNLLATIAGSATLIEVAVDKGGDPQVGAARILAATDQAAALVKRLFTLGGRPTDRVKIDLRKSVSEAADLVKASLRAPVSLVTQIPAEPMIAMADPTDVLQVILNLAINARDAMSGRSGQIMISLEPATAQDMARPMVVGTADPLASYVRLTISDTGPGIPQDVADKVFAPYFTTKGDKGTGLGLAVVASIVLSNQGCVQLETALGQGTTFTVYWPFDAMQARPMGPVPAGGLTGELRGKTILVVDDQQDVLDVLSAFLEAAGAEVAPATIAGDILDAVRDDPEAWDLLITDYDMPLMTGAELARAVRAHAPSLPVLLVTALPGIDGRSGSLFDFVLGKPINREALIAAAEQAMTARD
jgi:PAS domain S-box-containing protein